MKRLFILLLCLLLAASVTIPASATQSSQHLVIDDADLLSEQQERLLEEKANDLKSQYQLDVVILTVDTLQGTSAQIFADDFYDTHAYQDDGVLLLLTIQEREWYISTSGNAIEILTDYRIEQLGDAAVWHFSDGEYYDGFDAYLEKMEDYLYAHAHPQAYVYEDSINKDDYGVAEQSKIRSAPNLLLSSGIGVVVAMIVLLVMRSSMNTKKPQHSAAAYLKNGSFVIHTHQDMFLYSRTSKQRKQQSNSSGGSSVHRSSGGRRHGGGGGRF